MLNHSELEHMSQINILDIDPATLVEVENIFIDTDLNQAKKIEQYLLQIRNPYCFISGDTPVRVRFMNPDKPLSQSLLSYFSHLKST